MQFVDPNELLNATNGGLDIILDLYPGARTCVDFPNRKFKVRADEKTASGSLKKLEDGNWVVTDFGGDGVSRNGILSYQHETGKTYVQALRDLAVRYNVLSDDQKRDIFKPDYEERPASDEDNEKEWKFNIKDSWSDAEITTLFSQNTLKYVGWFTEEKKQDAYTKLAAVLRRYRFYSLSSYSLVKDRKVLTFKSNENYPIFLIDEEKFKKIYQPKHWDKGKRFMYQGEHQKGYVHGLIQAKKEQQRLVENAIDNEDDDSNPKLDELVICSGGSDAVNMAALGYWVCWMNSETAKLHRSQFSDMEKIAKDVYQLGDIDSTGLRAAHALAMEYLPLRTIELPADLSRYKDRRGNPAKDLRDYLNYHDYYQLRDLVKQALPYQFWTKVPQFEGKGEGKKVVGWQYKFRSVRALNFLSKNGFSRYRAPGQKTPYIYIKVDGNMVKQVEPSDIKDFVVKFLEGRRADEADEELRDMILNTTKLNETALSNLPYVEIDFNDTDVDHQYLFFKNQTWKITGNGIEDSKPGVVAKHIWEEEIIPHRIEKQDPFFTIAKNEDTGEHDIDIQNDKCLFLRYLIQTSRVHWRKDLEYAMEGKDMDYQKAYEFEHKYDIAGPHLSPEEIKEQKQHLINKIFAIGYLLHRYKDRSKTWFVFAMDNLYDEDSGSFGGSGKSLAFNLAIPKVLRKFFYLGGRNPKLTDNQFLYDGLTEHHRYIMIDDADEYLNFKFFFEAITGSLKVNPKNSQPFMIDFKKLGKFALTSNFRPKGLDPSTERRLLYAAFSDYYHNHGETDDYLETRRVSDDFGKNLFDDFNEDEWILFYNTMAQCLRFYLSTTEKINPPMDSVRKTNLMSAIGADFSSWADVYFSNDNLDTFVIKEMAFEDFRTRKKSVWKMQKFTRAMRDWCKLMGYTYNPKDFLNSQGRIIRRADDMRREKDGTWIKTGNKIATEMMYIQSLPELKDPDLQAELADNLPF